MPPDAVVFLVDVDNTLLDNDRIQEDFQHNLEREFGADARERYWSIQERLFADLGYRDYLGALQQYRVEYPDDLRVLSMSALFLDYPFADRLYTGALDVLQRFRRWSRTVVLTDGDAVFQPRKAERSGISAAADGNVLIYVHKEEMLEDVQRRYPARHYVLVDDKLRILWAVKQAWGQRVTTVFPKQGHFACDPAILSAYPTAADVAVAGIGDLLEYDLQDLVSGRHPTVAPSITSTTAR